jgi:alanine racemase
VSRPICARIDFTALRHNLNVVRNLAPQSRIWAVIKANGYGHGLLPVARALSGVEGFAVSSLEEGLCLREGGVRTAVLVLEGVFSREEVPQARQADLELVVHSEWVLEHLEAVKKITDWPRLWLKIDTGMNRLGFPPSRVQSIYPRLCSLSREPPGLMTHLAMADRPGDPMTRIQMDHFDEATRGLPGHRSLANSAALLNFPRAAADWIRPGLMLFGVSPLESVPAETLGLEPVMTLSTALMAVKPVKPGDAVGYGATWQAQRNGWIGIAAAGYGDGYPYHAPQGAPVRVGEGICPLIGRVSMDMIAIDLGPDPQPVGAPVILWGKGLPVEQIARCSGTIPYELLCGVAQRVRHEWRGFPVTEPQADHAASHCTLPL